MALTLDQSNAFWKEFDYRLMRKKPPDAVVTSATRLARKAVHLEVWYAAMEAWLRQPLRDDASHRQVMEERYQAAFAENVPDGGTALVFGNALDTVALAQEPFFQRLQDADLVRAFRYLSTGQGTARIDRIPVAAAFVQWLSFAEAALYKGRDALLWNNVHRASYATLSALRRDVGFDVEVAVRAYEEASGRPLSQLDAAVFTKTYP